MATEDFDSAYERDAAVLRAELADVVHDVLVSELRANRFQKELQAQVGQAFSHVFQTQIDALQGAANKALVDQVGSPRFQQAIAKTAATLGDSVIRQQSELAQRTTAAAIQEVLGSKQCVQQVSEYVEKVFRSNLQSLSEDLKKRLVASIDKTLLTETAKAAIQEAVSTPVGSQGQLMVDENRRLGQVAPAQEGVGRVARLSGPTPPDTNRGSIQGIERSKEVDRVAALTSGPGKSRVFGPVAGWALGGLAVVYIVALGLQSPPPESALVESERVESTNHSAREATPTPTAIASVASQRRDIWLTIMRSKTIKGLRIPQLPEGAAEDQWLCFFAPPARAQDRATLQAGGNSPEQIREFLDFAACRDQQHLMRDSILSAQVLTFVALTGRSSTGVSCDAVEVPADFIADGLAGPGTFRLLNTLIQNCALGEMRIDNKSTPKDYAAVAYSALSMLRSVGHKD